VRQPKVRFRLSAFVVALVLAAPVVLAGRSLAIAALFLVEFLADGTVPALTIVTPAPRAGTLAASDRFRPGLTAGAPLVLVHGLTPSGKEDPQLRQAARLLARAGFDVAVPTIPGLTRGRLRPEDARPVMTALAARPGRARLVSVSVGAGPAFLAAAHPATRDRVAAVLALGPYASALELIRFHLTGEYAWEGRRGRAPHDAARSRAVIEANAELADPALREALATGDAARVDAALEALPAQTRELIDELSPARVFAAIRVPVLLVHGRTDPAVPYTETLRLAAARPEDTQVVLVGAIGHVEGAAAGLAAVQDVLRLLGAVYAFVALD
jgi:pimeloyl-ACP methyl ester carboxylesterase